MTPWNAPTRRSIVAFRLVPLRSFARHSLVINHFSLLLLLASRILYSSGRQTEAIWPRATPERRYISLAPSQVLSFLKRAKVCNLTVRRPTVPTDEWSRNMHLSRSATMRSSIYSLQLILSKIILIFKCSVIIIRLIQIIRNVQIYLYV